jgi:non-ribosomal peptide synthetase component F
VPRGLPLFESILVFENVPLARVLAGHVESGVPLRLEFRHGADPSNYPLALRIFEGERLALRLAYATERIDGAAALRMLGHLERLLAAMARHPERRLAPARRAPPTSPSSARSSAPRTRRRSPCAGEELTYAELDRRANQVARALRRRGVALGILVGLAVERSLDLAVSVLAIFKAGGAYVPLDPAYPRERLAFLLADSGVAVLVGHERSLGRLPEHAAGGLAVHAIPGDHYSILRALHVAELASRLQQAIERSHGMPQVRA